MSHFASLTHYLGVSLELEANGKKETILAGHIEKLNLSLESYGHSCGIFFSSFYEKVDALLEEKGVIKATLSFKAINPISKQIMDPLFEIKGIVTHKYSKSWNPVETLTETPTYHEIWISDNAKATWEEHFPTNNIYVDQSMKEVLEKHANPEISPQFEWDKLEVKHPVIAFTLPHRNGISNEDQVSFYSFLFWYLHMENGIWAYDYKKHTYSIIGKKAKPAGEPFAIVEKWVETPQHIPAKPARFNSRTVKHTSERVENKDKENKDAFKSVRRDALSSENYHRFPDEAPETVHSTLAPEKDLLVVEFNEMEDLIIDKLLPGSGVSFKPDHGLGTWSKKLTKNYRVRSLYMVSDSIPISQKPDKTVQHYRSGIKVVLEEEEEPFVLRPAFLAPNYPFKVLGKVFSDIGDEEQTTYKIQESEKAPLGQYLVKVPFVEGGKKVIAPFTPHDTAQDFRPLVKNSEVELLIYFRTALINRCINWGPLTRYPSGVQGNQLMMGSNGKDEHTSINFEYKDGKNPYFAIKQSSSETQTQTLEVQKEELLITVDEKDKKTVLVKLNKDGGVIISFEDKSAGVTQQILFDGKNSTLIFKGNEGTSTIVQGPETIAVTCKNFNVDAEKITFTAKDTITEKAGTKIFHDAPVVDAPTKAMNIKP